MDTPTAESLRQLLRRADSVAGVVRLLRRLGLCGRLVELSAAARAAIGLDPAADVRRAFAGEPSAGVRVLLCLTGSQPDPALVVRLTRLAAAADPILPGLLVAAGPRFRAIVFSSPGLDGQVRQVSIDPRDARPAELDALRELAAGGERGVALALRLSRALDRSRVTRRFFRDFRARRAMVAEAWVGPPPESGKERGQLALLLLSRLMFLYFLQRRGHLAGEPAYLPELLRDWVAASRPETFYRGRLEPLFFGALNTRVERRSPAARSLGDLPFLNGGLFERTSLERRFPALDLPDDAMRGVFDGLLERYRFTAVDAASGAAAGGGEAGVDPEMLGRVFEGLMSPGRRGATGTFYTPAPVVDRVVRETLAAYLATRCGLEPARARALVTGDVFVDVVPADRGRLAEAVAGLRVLDPACGSGAFLLGALQRLSGLSGVLREPCAAPDAAARRRDVVARSLYGVDLQEDAALLCALRLWLALAQPEGDGNGEVAPLPNLDRRIRQGDALIDPLDLLKAGAAAGSPWTRVGLDAGIRRDARAISRLAAEYLETEPERREAVRARLSSAESRLAGAWLAGIERRLLHAAHELREQTTARDLFGATSERAPRAAAELREVESQLAELNRVRTALRERGSLPFFSFDVHFADSSAGGFDVVVSNPPWIRAHAWPSHLRRLVRERFEVCRPADRHAGAGPGSRPPRPAAQVDVAMLFLERSIRLLARPGALGMLLPAKFLRSLSAGRARALLLRETRVHSLEDHGLDHRAIFRADAFTAVLVAVRGRPTAAAAEDRIGPESAGGGTSAPGGHTRARQGRPVRVTMTRRGVRPLRFELDAAELPLVRGEADSPWLLAPADVRAAMRAMQAAGVPIGSIPGLRVRRGVMTGANDALVIRDVSPKLGDLAWIRAEGYHRARRAGRSRSVARRFTGLVEARALCSLVRGSDIAAWSHRSERLVVWRHDPVSALPVLAPPRLAAYLARHGSAAGDAGAGSRLTGLLKRLSTDTLRPKVAWQDLADTLKAVALPARVRGAVGLECPLLPLNTVYFIPTGDGDGALVLAGWLNSLPLRTFARAVAERAKDARFRFFAWTVAALPLPADWADGRVAAELGRISGRAHERGGILPEEQAELDAAVAAAFGLSGEQVRALERFDAWLRGSG